MEVRPRADARGARDDWPNLVNRLVNAGKQDARRIEGDAFQENVILLELRMSADLGIEEAR